MITAAANTLPDGYSIRSLTAAEFKPYWDEYHLKVFGDKPRVFLEKVLSQSERDQVDRLREHVKSLPCLRFGLFHGETFCGWHIGNQTKAAEFYMRNSAVLPEHRRKGLYSALLRHVVDDVAGRGYQTITSNHTAVNNAVIIPKLKLGFTITGFELSDTFGVLVRLQYFTNPDRRKILAFRAGEEQADADVRSWLGMT